MSTKVMIADDHGIFRMGLVMLIEASPDYLMVGQCDSLKGLDEKVVAAKPDVLLLDLNFGIDSSEEKIPSLSKMTKVIVLTAEMDPEVHKTCLKAGAQGLIMKGQAAEEVLTAISRVSKGEMWFDRSVLSTVVKELTTGAEDELNGERERIRSLSPRERDVIELVGEGLKNKEIAARLFITETTVRHHMTSILSKLYLTSRLELVIFAFRHGLARAPRRVQEK